MAATAANAAPTAATCAAADEYDVVKLRRVKC